MRDLRAARAQPAFHKVRYGHAEHEGCRTAGLLGWRGAASAVSGRPLLVTADAQLAAYSNAAFTSKWGGRDLVYVVTYHGCSDSTGNQVIALDAANLAAAPVWTFNSTGAYKMDYGSEGCSVDDGNSTKRTIPSAANRRATAIAKPLIRRTCELSHG